MMQTLLQYIPEEQADDIIKQDEKRARFKHIVVKLKKDEYRIMKDTTGKYPPYKLDYSNFITCLACQSDFFVSLKSYRHHWTKIHGGYTEQKGEDLLQKYILNKEMVTLEY